MGACYVRSGSGGAGTGADWANAYTTLTLAIAGQAAGDTYYVSEDHAESTAGAVTLAFKGTWAAPDRVLCVNHAGTVPPVAADIAATATVSTTGANNLTVGAVASGAVYIEGIKFQAGSAANSASLLYGASAAGAIINYKNCGLILNNTNNASRITLSGSSNNIITFDNCAATFGSTSQQITTSNVAGVRLAWTNLPGSAAILGSVPTSLFAAGSGAGVSITLDGLDLSPEASGKTLFTAPTVPGFIGRAINCKLGASVTIAGTPTARRARVEVIGADSTGAVARNEIYAYTGTLTTETTIVRTGGASDGTTPNSWKIVTTANSKTDFPFDTFEGAIWNDTTGSSKTLTVHIVTDNVILKDDEIWLEVEYLGSSATPVVSVVSDKAATVLTAGANQTTSTETWTTTGLGTPVKQKLDVTFTPQMKGPVRWRVKVAKASTTVYVCPKAELV